MDKNTLIRILFYKIYVINVGGIMQTVTKLTLSASPETIAMAKQLASERKTSVSALFAKIIRDLHQLEHLTAPSRFHHAVEDLLGSADGWPTDMSYDEIIRQAIQEKHGVKP